MAQILDYQTPLMAERSGHSWAGIASAVLALVMMVLLVAGAIIAILARQSRSWTTGAAVSIVTPLPLCILCMIAGLICGIVGVAQGKRKRLWAVVGLSIHGLALLVLFMGLLVAGLG